MKKKAVSGVLNVTISINESIEGRAPVTIIIPISGQLGTTVINIGHLDERDHVLAVQLDYYNDSISGYEISSVTNVNNYSEVIIDQVTMAKNGVSVSNNFSKAVAKRAHIYQAEETK